MMDKENGIPSWTNRAQIEDQLSRMLANPHFSQSKRYPHFLKYVVQEYIEGRADWIKERTLGIEVFGKGPSYEPMSDPIVRVTAAEIRKRIALYYQERDHESELRILLPTGSYVPTFERPKSTLPPVAPPIAQIAATPLESPKPAASRIAQFSLPRRTRFLAVTAGLLLLTVLAVAGLRRIESEPSPLVRFWQPLLSTKSSILISIPQHLEARSIAVYDPNDLSKVTVLQRDQKLGAVANGDMDALLPVYNFIRTDGNSINLKDESNTTLSDLRETPAVILGGLDNAWSIRMTNKMRFHFSNSPAMNSTWIVDRKTGNHWGDQQILHTASTSFTDYALVARFRDPETMQFTVIAAGLTQGGTNAAGEFITQPADAIALEARVPGDWQNRNIEIVIGTNIVEGHPGPPHILAVESW
jgi:hypothetical protein